MLVSVGVVGIAAGVVLWLTAPERKSKQAVRFTPTANTTSVGFAVGGTRDAYEVKFAQCRASDCGLRPEGHLDGPRRIQASVDEF